MYTGTLFLYTSTVRFSILCEPSHGHKTILIIFLRLMAAILAHQKKFFKKKKVIGQDMI